MKNLPKWLRALIFSLGGILIFYLLARIIIAILSPRPETLGVSQGRLSVCPSYPACVSSQAETTDEVHHVEALKNTDSVEIARVKIKNIASQITGAALINEDSNYLYYEIKVAPFGFVDDLEFFFTGDNAPIEIRSSARVPYYDFEVNRERVEAIRLAFE